jgi:hypothetical protein
MILDRYPAGTRWISQGKNPPKTLKNQKKKNPDDDLDDFSCKIG